MTLLLIQELPLIANIANNVEACARLHFKLLTLKVPQTLGASMKYSVLFCIFFSSSIFLSFFFFAFQHHSTLSKIEKIV